MDRENEKQLTLEEKAKIFEEEARAEMTKVSNNGEWPKVNCVLQSGRGIVHRAMQELARRVEVVHGRWVYEPVEFTYEKDIKCSVCSAYVDHATNYCPNCGAKMDGERKDNEITE